jgi:hypothetical protein
MLAYNQVYYIAYKLQQMSCFHGHALRINNMSVKKTTNNQSPNGEIWNTAKCFSQY